MKKYILAIAISLFIVHYIVQYYFKMEFPFLDSYLDPFLGVLVMLSYLHIYKFEGEQLIDTILITIVYGFISELVFPVFSSKSVYDPLDFVAILAGMLTFIILTSCSQNHLTENS